MKFFPLMALIGFFVVGCGGGEDDLLQGESLSQGDSFSENSPAEVFEMNSSGPEEESRPPVTELAQAQQEEVVAPEQATVPEEPVAEDETAVEEPPPAQEEAVQFSAENFQVHETHVCRRPGAQVTYLYELYENRTAGPFLCYLVHKYDRCGSSYSSETGSCYHNAVRQANFCRDKLNQNIARRIAAGYQCEQIEESDSPGEGDTEEPSTESAEDEG